MKTCIVIVAATILSGCAGYQESLRTGNYKQHQNGLSWADYNMAMQMQQQRHWNDYFAQQQQNKTLQCFHSGNYTSCRQF